MFSKKIRGGKAFGAAQKIFELKKKISKLKKIKTPTILIKKLTDNMNQTESEKHGYSSNYIEKKSLSSEKLRITFNFERNKKSKQVEKRLDKYNKDLHKRQKKKKEKKTKRKPQYWRKRFTIGRKNKKEVSPRKVLQKLCSRYFIF